MPSMTLPFHPKSTKTSMALQWRTKETSTRQISFDLDYAAILCKEQGPLYIAMMVYLKWPVKQSNSEGLSFLRSSCCRLPYCPSGQAYFTLIPYKNSRPEWCHFRDNAIWNNFRTKGVCLVSYIQKENPRLDSNPCFRDKLMTGFVCILTCGALKAEIYVDEVMHPIDEVNIQNRNAVECVHVRSSSNYPTSAKMPPLPRARPCRAAAVLLLFGKDQTRVESEWVSEWVTGDKALTTAPSTVCPTPTPTVTVAL